MNITDFVELLNDRITMAGGFAVDIKDTCQNLNFTAAESDYFPGSSVIYNLKQEYNLKPFPPTPDNDPSDKKKLIIILGSVGGGLALLLLAVCCCFRKRRNNLEQRLIDEKDEEKNPRYGSRVSKKNSLV